MKNVTAILTADIELRMHAPICRTDDYWETVQRKIRWLAGLQLKHKCPILDGGDLFDKRYKTNPSHELLGWVLKNLPRPFCTVPGNHDLPGKSYENYKNSAMAVLENAKILKVPHPYMEFIGEHKDIGLYGFPWGSPIELPAFFADVNVALIHTMVYEKNPPFPGCEGFRADQLMKKLKGFNLIVSGHNHQTFVYQRGKQLLVNPGSLIRNDADQIDHRPSVFLWDHHSNEVEQVFVPIKKNVITREHIDEKEIEQDRLDAFISKLGDVTEHSINFLKNLENAANRTDIPVDVRSKIDQYIEGIDK